jgi:hypothetical protein
LPSSLLRLAETRNAASNGVAMIMNTASDC